MNRPRASEEDYIQFLIAAPSAPSAVEAAESAPGGPAHDAYTRLLARLEPDPETLWAEVRPLLGDGGVLVVDDTTLDKPYARKVDLVSHHWSGKHKTVVKGISLVTAAWYDGGRVLPVDYRVYHPDRPEDGTRRTKNDHFADMLAAAKARGLAPRCVLFDGWYASLGNLKLVRGLGWTFLTRLKSNRLARVGRGDALPLSRQPIAESGTTVWLPGYGELLVFRVTATARLPRPREGRKRDGGAEHWATNDPAMTALGRYGPAQESWAVETYHRGLKQHAEVERCQARLARSQLNHAGLAIRAFVRLEWHRWKTGVSWLEAKRSGSGLIGGTVLP